MTACLRTMWDGLYAPTLSLCALLTFVMALPNGRGAESSELAPLAAQSLLLDVTRAGTRLVAVGDRGHILLSDNEGVSWRQVTVPTRAMLTGVSFGSPTHGWAVGHDGVILASTDAGETWIRQHPDEGIETVFLDVHFLDAARGFAVGAYARFLATNDGGVTWTPVVVSEDEVHLNQVTAGPDGTLYLPGESGNLLASRDGGRQWSRLEVPYDGSLYGLIPMSDRALLVYGLRGHVFYSDDQGESWVLRKTESPVLIMAGVRLKAGPIVLAGSGGNFHVSRDGGVTFTAWKPAAYTSGVSALLEAADGALIVAGEKGVTRLALP